MFGISLSVLLSYKHLLQLPTTLNEQQKLKKMGKDLMSSGKWWPLLIMVEPERNRSLPVIYWWWIWWPLIQTFILLKAFNGFFQGQLQLYYCRGCCHSHLGFSPFISSDYSYSEKRLYSSDFDGYHCYFRRLWDIILMCLAKILVSGVACLILWILRGSFLTKAQCFKIK